MTGASRKHNFREIFLRNCIAHEGSCEAYQGEIVAIASEVFG